MDADVAEVDVEKCGAGALKVLGEGAGLGAGDEEGAAEDGFLPKAAEGAGPGALEGDDGIEREACGFLAFLGEDEGLVCAERGDLPVDVEHLRLEEGGAVLGGYGLCGVRVGDQTAIRFLQMRVSGNLERREGWMETSKGD